MTHWRSLLLCIPAILLASCALSPSLRGQVVQLDAAANVWQARDGTRFPYRCWLPDSATPRAVVIGVHGLSGAACDLAVLGEAMRHAGVAVYASELRGQGNDPVRARIGDIRAAHEWHQDLWDFHCLVVRRHPGIPVIWAGESLGSLIVCGAAVLPPHGVVAPAALVLVSPIPAFDPRIRVLHRQLLALGALAKPKNKLPLTAWAGGDADNWQMTAGSRHIEQLEKTPWAVREFTLRFYHVLATMVGRMTPLAPRIRQPVFLAHAAGDVFATSDAVRYFAARVPKSELKVYSRSHHLLFYDVEKDLVAADIVRWIAATPWADAVAKP